MRVTLKNATDYIIRCLKAKKVCMLAGDPGLGKSAIVHEIANKFNLELIDIRLSTFCPEDLSGLPMLKGEIAEFVPMNTFPLVNTEIPKGKTGWLIFLDEMNSASLAVQCAAYKLVLDRQVGQHTLHPNSAIVCAGNLSTNGAVVNRLSTAMQSRLIHLEATVSPEEWLKWGTLNNIDHRVLAYINYVPDNLHKLDPKHNDKTFPSPRTWDFLSSLIKNVNTTDLKDILPLLAGTIGEGAAHEFVTYTEVYSSLPTYTDIIRDPKNTPINGETGMLFAITHLIPAFFKQADLEPVMDFIERLPIEFQTITLQSLIGKTPKLIKTKRINSWTAEKGEFLI